MRKIFVVAVVAVLVMTAANAQELQLAGGFEFGLAGFDVDNSFSYRTGSYTFLLSEKAEYDFFAPGISFTMRLFPAKPVNSLGSYGFFFRDRALFVTNLTQTGTNTVECPNVNYLGLPRTENISEKRSAADGDFFISFLDFAMGLSSKLALSERFNFYSDIGANLTIGSVEFDVEDASEKDTLTYIGSGLFVGLAAQINFTQNLYLEMGINSIMNILSYQEGKINLPALSGNDYQTIKYEDAGVVDLVSAALYIQIGWRIDLKPLTANRDF
jgi:hypothetical protein